MHRRNLKKLVAIHFHPSHLQTKLIDTSFCALAGLFLTKLNHYFNVPINTNVFVVVVFAIQTKQNPLDVGETVAALALLLDTTTPL